jgi:hypothetical protein
MLLRDLAVILAVGLLFAFAVVTAIAHPASPSFNCRKAQTLDERTICHDGHLAELDRLASTANNLTPHSQEGGGPGTVQEVVKEALEARHACGADQLCMLDQQALVIEGIGLPTSPSSPRVPVWVGSYRLKLFAERSQPLSKGLPVRVGQCTVTKITDVTASAEYDPGVHSDEMRKTAYMMATGFRMLT